MRKTKALYKRMRRMMALMMSVLLLVCIFQLPANSAFADSNGMIRVKLTRLGSSVSSITMTTVGGYSANGTFIASGSTVKVVKSGTSLVLTAGGNQIASGTQITMSRTQGGTGCGVRFTSPSLSNLFAGDLVFSLSGSAIQTVLNIYIETYLYGVVPYEMSNSFPLEALKAQAVAARTYAMRAKRSGGSYDVTDNTNSQVFKGYNASYSTAINAVDATRGVCLMSGSSYAQCYYTASNGGQTESAANAWGGSNISYLTVKDDPYDRENPNSIVKSYSIPKDPSKKALNSQLKSALIAASASQLAEKGLSANASDITIESITAVQPHTPKYAAPSRAYTKLRFTMKLTGKSASTGNQVSTQVEVNLNTYSQLQSMLGLSINSADNEIVAIEERADSFLLTFTRYGHGVGLSQRGAQWMAKQYGKSYEEILSFYYPGAERKRLSLNEVISGSAGTTPAPTPTKVPVQSEDGYSTLQEGDSGEAVKLLQTRLRELGYFTGTPLGNYKTLTVAAVKAYQNAMGLAVDGIATPELQKMIFGEQKTPEPTATPAPDLPSTDDTNATVTLGSPSSKLNVRKAASTSSGVAGTLAHGTRVTVLEEGEWCHIRSGSLTGYVKRNYLRLDNAQEQGYQTLQYGDSGEKVRKLQEQLGKMGYFTGTPLGNYKSLTVSAVQAYQTAMGLTADGVATPELQKMIFAGQMPEATQPPVSVTSAKVSLSSTSSRLNVRREASTSSSIVGTLRHGQQVNILGVNGSWSRIQSGNTTGYVMSSYLTTGGEVDTPSTSEPSNTPEPVYGTATVSLTSTSSRLNIRREASTSSSIVGTLRHGQQVTILGTSGSWSRIQSSNTIGYVMTSYLKQAGASATPTPMPTQSPAVSGELATIALSSTSSKLNVRREASTSSSIVGTLRHGQQVTVLGTSGKWSRIQSGSLTGYVMTSYLSTGAASQPTQTPVPETTLPSGSGGTTYRTLQYGDSGEAVRRLQARLKEQGYFTGELGGNYLKLTRAAVEAWQEANNWTVDGIATPELQEAVFGKSEPTVKTNAVVRTSGDSLNLRKSASTNSTVLARLKNGDRVYVSGSQDDWYQVQKGSYTGYVKADYIELD